ncbi:hypothetical protein TDB9533_01206 [Thalassocella blandensis]|nr:hypothetical protein TDB9533_01206 [Thalassocella blandensis]
MTLIHGCASNLYLSEKDGLGEYKNISPQVVQVSNPEHKNFEVLVKSGLFEVSSDPGVNAILTLEQSEIYGRCGNGLLGAIFTAGIFPGYLDASESFEYTIHMGGEQQKKQYWLRMYERYSIWEWLFKPFNYSRSTTKAKALNVSVFKEKNNLKNVSN